MNSSAAATVISWSEKRKAEVVSLPSAHQKKKGKPRWLRVVNLHKINAVAM